MEPLEAAARLPGKAQAVNSRARHRCDLEGKVTVTIPSRHLTGFGISRRAY